MVRRPTDGYTLFCGGLQPPLLDQGQRPPSCLMRSFGSGLRAAVSTVTVILCFSARQIQYGCGDTTGDKSPPRRRRASDCDACLLSFTVFLWHFAEGLVTLELFLLCFSPLRVIVLRPFGILWQLFVIPCWFLSSHLHVYISFRLSRQVGVMFCRLIDFLRRIFLFKSNFNASPLPHQC